HHQDTLIFAKELQTNIISFQNLIKGDLGFGNIALDFAKLYVKTYKGEETDNLSIFSQKFNTGKKSESPFSLFGNDVTLTNGRIKISDENLENTDIFIFNDVNVVADNFKIEDINVNANILSLSLVADLGITIKDLQADFSYTATNITLKDLNLETTESKIVGDLDLDYSKRGFADFVNDVVITASLKDSKISTNDLNAFYNEFGPDQLILLDTELTGTLNNFTANNLKFQTGDTNIEGDYAFENILDSEKEYAITA